MDCGLHIMDRLQFSVLLASAATEAAGLFVPVYARQLGIGYFGVGAVAAVLTLGTVISFYLFGVLSDRTGKNGLLVRAGLLASAIVFFGQLLIRDYASFLAIEFIAGIAVGIYTYPLFSVVAYSKDYKRSVSSLAAYAALGCFFGAVLAVFVTDIRALFALSGLLFLAAFAISLGLKVPPTAARKVSLLPGKLLKTNWGVYLTNFLRHLGANAFWAVFPLYLVASGASLPWVAAITSINSLAQFFLMRGIGRFSKDNLAEYKKLVVLGAAASIVVFAAYLVLQYFLFAVFTAVLVAISWSCLNIGSSLYLTARNKEKAAANGLLGSTLSAAQVVGLFAGGAIAQAWGISATLIFAVGLCLLALAAAATV